MSLSCLRTCARAHFVPRLIIHIYDNEISKLCNIVRFSFRRKCETIDKRKPGSLLRGAELFKFELPFNFRSTSGYTFPYNAPVLTCPEPYFLSEGLYTTPEELENTREVTLHVITIGAFIEDAAKKDDFTAVSSALRQYLPEKDTPYILDIDLDFFSTKNPFKDLHERVNLYDKLAPLFTYKRTESNDPEVLKESMIERNQQLSELKTLFSYLEEHRSLKGYDGSKTSRYEAVDRLFQEVTSAYRDSEIDWMLVYNAGCTIDDTVLPEHVTEPNDLDRLINGTFRLFLAALPTLPTIVTIARSSEDDYTPLENVDQIQVDVLDQLRERLGPEIDIKMIYQNEEQQ